MTKKMRKAHSAVSIPIEGEGSKTSSKVFPHRSHVITSVPEFPATGKNISKPSRPMVVVAKRAAPLSPVQQSQYKKLRFVPPEYQAELRNWVKDSSPMYRTPLRGTIAPLQQQSGTFNTSSAIGRTPPVDMMHRESAYSKAQSAQGATKMARKKKMEEGAGHAPSGASAEEILFSSLGGASMKKRSIKRPIPPKMPPTFPPPGGEKNPRGPMPKPGGINPGGMYTGGPNARPKNPTAMPSTGMGMGKMSKANRLPMGERLSNVGGWPVGTDLSTGRPRGPGKPGRRPTNPDGSELATTMPVPITRPGRPGMDGKRPISYINPPSLPKPGEKPGRGLGKPDMSNKRYSYTQPKPDGDIKPKPKPRSPEIIGLPRNPGSPDGRYGGGHGPYDGGSGSRNMVPGGGGSGNSPERTRMEAGMGGVNKSAVRRGFGPGSEGQSRQDARAQARYDAVIERQNPVFTSYDDKGNIEGGPKGAYLDMLSRASGKTRGGPARKMAKSAGQGAFINGKLAPQSHSLTKSASCPDCGGKMTKGMCKNMCKGLVMFNTNKGMMDKPMTKAASCPDCGGKMSKGMCKNMCKGMMHKSTYGATFGDGKSKYEHQLKQEAGNWMRQGAFGTGFPSTPGKQISEGGGGTVIGERGAGTKDFGYAIGTSTAKPNKGGNKGVGTRKMSKGAGMCKCGSGMSKSMCKCGM